MKISNVAVCIDIRRVNSIVTLALLFLVQKKKDTLEWSSQTDLEILN